MLALCCCVPAGRCRFGAAASSSAGALACACFQPAPGQRQAVKRAWSGGSGPPPASAPACWTRTSGQPCWVWLFISYLVLPAVGVTAHNYYVLLQLLRTGRKAVLCLQKEPRLLFNLHSSSTFFSYCFVPTRKRVRGNHRVHLPTSRLSHGILPLQRAIIIPTINKQSTRAQLSETNSTTPTREFPVLGHLRLYIHRALVWSFPPTQGLSAVSLCPA